MFIYGLPANILENPRKNTRKEEGLFSIKILDIFAQYFASMKVRASGLEGKIQRL